MGSTWGRQDPGGPHVGRLNLAILAYISIDVIQQAYTRQSIYWNTKGVDMLGYSKMRQMKRAIAKSCHFIPMISLDIAGVLSVDARPPVDELLKHVQAM